MTKPYKCFSYSYFFALGIVFASGAVRGQNVIPQIADGGGWKSTLVVANTSTHTAAVSITFFQQINGNATLPWVPTFLEANVTPQNLTLTPGATMLLHTTGTPEATISGWAQLQGDPAIAAYAIFTQTVSGRPDQDATAPAAAASSRVLVPYDNTNGFVTAIAIANAESNAQGIGVGLQNSADAGPETPPSPFVLPAMGHASFNLPQQYSATAGQSGILEFSTTSGDISVIALRFNPTGSFTSAPAFSESGAGILGDSLGILPAFHTLSILSADLNPGAPAQIQVVNAGTLANPSYTGSISSGNQFSGTFVNARWNTVTVNGLTVTFSNFAGGVSGIGSNVQPVSVPLTTGTLTITLAPQFGNATGGAAGAIALGPNAITGNFTATYTLN